MQTFLKVFATFIIIFIAVGLVLDNEFEISREVTINGSPLQIHAYVSDLNQWPHWNPWEQQDPTVKISIGEISAGVGATQSWTGQSGNGSLKITQSSEVRGITYDLTFDEDPTVFVAGVHYRIEGNNTIVTWYMKGEMQPIIIGNYFAQFMDTLVGESFTLGLNNLKSVVEKGQ